MKDPYEHSPANWSRGIDCEPQDESDLRAKDIVLSKCHREGWLAWNRLMRLNRWRFLQRRTLTRQLASLRIEYRDQLELIQTRLRAPYRQPQRFPNGAVVARGTPAQPKPRRSEVYSTPEPIIAPYVAPTSVDWSSDVSRDSSPSFTGGGGDFGGAGASGSWDDSSNSDSSGGSIDD